MELKKLLIATTNQGKLREFKELLHDLPVECISLKDLGSYEEIEETGKTFSENADLKALGYAKQFGMLALGEDSGLCCDALEGAPGVYSARFSSEGDDGNNSKLLRLMEGIPVNCRGAQYESHISIAFEEKVLGRSSGIVRGVIHKKLEGDGGFGYDPLFFYPPFQKTFGQVSAEKKNGVSHRFHAMQDIRQVLEKYLSEMSKTSS